MFLGAFRRDVFTRFGNFDPCATPNEDAELNQRILQGGGRIYLSRAIVVHYVPRSSLRALARQYFRYGKGRARTTLKHRRLPTVRPLLPFALVVTLVCGLIAGRSVAALAFVSFHLHLVCDLLGSGREWPIAYLYPFSPAEIGLSWGWELASWQNVTIMIALLAAMAFTARRWGRTFAEGFLPPRLADEVAKTIARWF